MSLGWWILIIILCIIGKITDNKGGSSSRSDNSSWPSEPSYIPKRNTKEMYYVKGSYFQSGNLHNFYSDAEREADELAKKYPKDNFFIRKQIVKD